MSALPLPMVDCANVPTAVIVPVGPGTASALDTLDSVGRYCSGPHEVIIVDDFTKDGTYEAIKEQGRPNWRILRNARQFGVRRLVHTLSMAYRYALSETDCQLVFRLDQDALLIGDGVLNDALSFAQANPAVGLFGVYAHDYDRPRSFVMHERLIKTELGWTRKLLGITPSWENLLALAERRGYRRGDNVFGGAYFVTRECLDGMRKLGALDIPYRWHSRMMEDVYYSMAAVAAGFELGHFGAPEGPLCLEWQGLPHPAEDMIRAGFKVVHSVDKGKNTDRASNDGRTAREVFRSVRMSAVEKI
jgi:GT2 family glycosyltransferase